MERFCKLHETPEHGQLLVLLQLNNEDIPEVRFFAQPEGLGVCSIAISFTDDDEGAALAEAALAKSDLDFCVKQTAVLFQMARDAHSETE